MHLRSVQMINWRSYKNVRFNFPIPTDNQNITIVMAPNEYGKTSFFEAIALGLFGPEGVELVMRARHHNEEGRISYRKLMQNILHSRTVETGQASCAVNLEWEDDNNEPVEIRRVWYFKANGEHKPGDDELIIYDGSSHLPVDCPPTVLDKNIWYQNWIKQRFLEPSLARFFLFDGEEVQRLADRKAEDQIRIGIRGLLGLPILENLKESLSNYAQRYDRDARTYLPAQNVTIESLEKEIRDLQNQIDVNHREQDQLVNKISDLDSELVELDRHLAGRPEPTVDRLKKLLEDAKLYEDNAKQALEELEKLLARDVALGIAGSNIREETINRLCSEERLESWQAGKDKVLHDIDRFAGDLSDRLNNLKPPILGSRNSEVVSAAKQALEALWYPMSDDCANDYLHPALKGPVRAQALQRLQEIGNKTEVDVFRQLESFNQCSEQAIQKKQEYQELEPIAPELQSLAERYRKSAEQKGQNQEKVETLQREIRADKSRLEQMKTNLMRMLTGREDARPLTAKANIARKYGKLVDSLLEDAQKLEVDVLGREMTAIWKTMAQHSDRVDRIDISPEFEIRMLAEDGTNLHLIDRSAGASQIFTQSLIAAVTRISGRIFPFVIDTPLARLSKDHRFGVLKVLGQQPGQVILLSTDEEVVDDKYQAVKNKIAAYFQLEVNHDPGGIASTNVRVIELAK